MTEGKKGSNVVDVSHMYVGPQQRASMKARLYDVARKKGYSHNQATALAEQGVRDFVAGVEARRREAIDNEPEV